MVDLPRRFPPSGPLVDRVLASFERTTPTGVIGPGLVGLTTPDEVVQMGSVVVSEEVGPFGVGPVTAITPQKTGVYRAACFASYTGALTTFAIALFFLDDPTIGIAAGETSTLQGCSTSSPVVEITGGRSVFPLLVLGAGVTVQRATFSLSAAAAFT